MVIVRIARRFWSSLSPPGWPGRPTPNPRASSIWAVACRLNSSLIKAGTFKQGSPADEPGRGNDEPCVRSP